MMFYLPFFPLLLPYVPLHRPVRQAAEVVFAQKLPKERKETGVIAQADVIAFFRAL